MNYSSLTAEIEGAVREATSAARAQMPNASFRIQFVSLYFNRESDLVGWNVKVDEQTTVMWLTTPYYVPGTPVAEPWVHTHGQARAAAVKRCHDAGVKRFVTYRPTLKSAWRESQKGPIAHS